MEPYLYHGIKWYNYDLLKRILKCGYILPRCELEPGLVTDKNNIFNGTKYISLCQKSLDFDNDYMFRSSFDEFIFCKPVLVLENKNIDIIYPNTISIIEKDMMSPEEWKSKLFSDDEERISYFIDEVQTKNKISLKDNLIAVGLPSNQLKLNYSLEEQKKLYSSIRDILVSNNFDVPIIDSSIYNFADNKECIKKYTLNK